MNIEKLIEIIEACHPSRQPTADQVVEARKVIDGLSERERNNPEIDHLVSRFGRYEAAIGEIRIVDYVGMKMVLRHPNHPRVKEGIIRI